MADNREHLSTSPTVTSARLVRRAVPPLRGSRGRRRLMADPPEMESRSITAFFFVLAVLVVALVGVGAVVALNAVADPYGALGTHKLPTMTTSDRTVKADALAAYSKAPEVVILGSSRAMRYEPEYIEEQTGLLAFNAAVNGIGGTVDMWAMTQYIDEIFPQATPSYIWLLDVEAFVPVAVGSRTASEPRLSKYVSAAAPEGGLQQTAVAIAENRASLLSLTTARDSVRLLWSREEAAREERDYRRTIRPDGALVERRFNEATYQQQYQLSVKRYTELYGGVYTQLDPEARQYFEKTLAFMNGRGLTPVIALSPISPALRAIVGPMGWDTRREELLAYLQTLQERYAYTLLDMSDPQVFAADPVQWHDGVHMTAVNSRKAIDYILQQTGGGVP